MVLVGSCKGKVVKAIQLELVSNLTSEAFLAAFRRYIARTGRCTDLYSDCGSNFVGANRELGSFASQLQNENFFSLQANDGTTWHFNPPDINLDCHTSCLQFYIFISHLFTL